MTPADAIFLVERANSAEDLFPSKDPAKNRKMYRELAKQLHPDVNPGPTAGDAFDKLNKLYGSLLGPPDPKPTWVLSTKKHSYVVCRDSFAHGAASQLYAAWSVEDGEERPSVLKMPRNPDKNDRIEREAMTLRRLQADGDPRFRAFAPVAHELLRHRNPTSKVDRTCLVLESLDGFYSLADVMVAFPKGIEGRDVAWMWRRLLVALGFAHHVGIIHGAVWPEHVMIHPKEHGVVLVGWGSSVELGGTVQTIVAARRSSYPPEILDEKPVNESADIYMAATTMLQVLGDSASAPMRAFAQSCRFMQPTRRPHDAWALKEEYDELLERLYGKRKFIPFQISTAPRLNRQETT